jgi:hypothetical protein
MYQTMLEHLTSDKASNNGGKFDDGRVDHFYFKLDDGGSGYRGFDVCPLARSGVFRVLARKAFDGSIRSNLSEQYDHFIVGDRR